MKRLIFPVACSACLSFIVWIMPLGFFINPSQEKIACDGQRAMCMCHVMMKHSLSSDKAMEHGIAIKAGTADKENSSGSGSNYFVSTKPALVLNLQSVSVFENQFLSYKSPFLAALEYVPKV